MWKTGLRGRGWRDMTRDTRVKNWGKVNLKSQRDGRMKSQTTEGWIQ